MKLHALGASAVTLALAFTSSASAMDDNLRSFTIAATSSVVIATSCDHFELVSGALRKVADRNGVTSEEADAIFQAILAQADQPYEQAALIPEVTVVVRDTMHQAYRMLRGGRDRAAMCGAVADSAVEAGFIRRK